MATESKADNPLRPSEEELKRAGEVGMVLAAFARRAPRSRGAVRAATGTFSS